MTGELDSKGRALSMISPSNSQALKWRLVTKVLGWSRPRSMQPRSALLLRLLLHP